MKKISPLTVTVGAAAALGLVLTAAPAHADTAVDEPSSFTSAFTVLATPDTVVNNDGVAAPGEPGAAGTFSFRVNSDLDIICYDIELTGVTGDYQSPARTATHIHQADAGKPGPPRIAFPNPAPIGDGPRTSSGCMQGPFTTGVLVDGVDTGTGFTLAQLEANPAGFSADSHTASFAAGVVRGQLTQVPVGGIDTGAGGTAAESSALGAGTGIAAGVAALLAATGVVLRLRRRASTR
ncbi:CHRD domain-containing protein [Microbacterium sp. 1.5R]|uniref:CHRD domain-containing protein n=1 Tax=Microbacterium sp. 1.5R TaxID=1916917 RepID=UPI0011A41F49|nr:CHRD domain-containing protein [Microbacterium sp. 1.5R]